METVVAKAELAASNDKTIRESAITKLRRMFFSSRTQLTVRKQQLFPSVGEWPAAGGREEPCCAGTPRRSGGPVKRGKLTLVTYCEITNARRRRKWPFGGITGVTIVLARV